MQAHPISTMTAWYRRTVCLAIALLLWSPSAAPAQIAPVGAHHLNVGPAAGGGGAPTPIGTYSQSVPLELPSGRGNIPIPLAVVYTGSPSLGAAGSGWDIPLSYMRISHSTMRRKPTFSSFYANNPIESAPRVVVSIGGNAMQMSPTDIEHTFRPYAASAYSELKMAPGNLLQWHLDTTTGLRYVFTPSNLVTNLDSSPAATTFNDEELYLLTEIRRLDGRDRATFDYQIRRISIPYSSGGTEINLGLIRYTFRSDGTAPLYEVRLAYEDGAVEVTRDAGHATARMSKLTEVSIQARDNHRTDTTKVLRKYVFGYKPDIDTNAPRLEKVDLVGEAGVQGPSSLPIARYQYGDATLPAPTALEPDRRVASFAPVLPVQIGDNHQSPDAIATSTTANGFIETGGPNDRIRHPRSTTRTTSLLHDFTGDGLPDYVYRRGSSWRMIVNRLGAGGAPSLYAATEAEVVTWSEPSELYVQTTVTVMDNFGGVVGPPFTDTWVTFMDWNGDGRPDVLDARGSGWTLYLNEGVQGTTLHWRPVSISVSGLVDALEARGHNPDSFPLTRGAVSISRSKSAPRTYQNRCQQVQLTCVNGVCWVPEGEALTACPQDTVTSTGDLEIRYNASYAAISDTIRDWDVVDTNGDRFPDFLISDQTSRLCRDVDNRNWDDNSCASPPDRPPGDLGDRTSYRWRCQQTVTSFLSPGVCPGSEDGERESTAVTILNSAGVQIGVAGGFRYDQPLSLGRTSGGVSWWSNGANDVFRNHEDLFPIDSFAQVEAGRERFGPGVADDGLFEFVGGTPFFSNRHSVCSADADADTPYTSQQLEARVDLNGDGRLDVVYFDGDFPSGSWSVRYSGTGVPRHISPGHGFAISSSTGECGGDSKTTGGLIDLNGDGRPEYLSAVVGGTGLFLVSEASVSDSYAGVHVAGGHGAGRLIGVSNGHGATTRVDYSNNKQLTLARHDIPLPEIVVERTWVDIDEGATPTTPIAPTYFGYADPSMRFDPLWAAWTFVGYKRTVTVSGVRTPGAVTGTATIADLRLHRDLDWFEPTGYRGRVLSTVPRRITLIEGQFDVFDGQLETDLRLLLSVDVDGEDADARIRGGSTTAPELKEFTTGDISDPSSHVAWWAQECHEVFPSTGMADIESPLCSKSGIVYTESATSWEGAKPFETSTENVAVRQEVRETDAIGRPTRTVNFGDVRTTSDDLCQTIEYTQPDGHPLPWFTTLVFSVRTDDCGASSPPPGDDTGSGDPITIAGVSFLYDDEGRMASRLVERYDVDTGELLNGFEAERVVSFDTFGNPTRVEKGRAQGVITTQITTLTYDTYGFTPRVTTVSSTDQATSLRTEHRITTFNGQQRYFKDTSGNITYFYTDNVGRHTMTAVRTASVGTSSLLLDSVRYDDDASPRVVTVSSRPGAPLDDSSQEAWVQSRTFLDALGRPRSTQRRMGEDYDDVWHAQFTLYDSLGRVAYRSAPQLATQAAYVPDAASLPYGTSYFYDAGSRVWATATQDGRATGDDPGFTDVASNRYVTRTSQDFIAGERVVRTIGPGDMTIDNANPMSSEYGRWTSSEVRTTAINRPTFSARLIGHDYVDNVLHGQDRLGRATTTSRHAGGPDFVTWTSRFDSLGNLLERNEPGVSPVTFSYDDWGALLSSEWADGASTRVSTSSYDGLGRPSEYHLDRRTGQQTTREWSQHYYYDEHSGSDNQPGSLSLAGKLSWVHVPDVGDEFYGYDVAGRLLSTTTVHADEGVPYRTTEVRSIDGNLTTLQFDLPGRTETVAYTYDSANQLRTAVHSDGETESPLFVADEVDSLGRYLTVTLGNGVEEHFDYEQTALKRLTSWSVNTSGGEYQRAIEARDADGRITQLREQPAAGQATTFVHDYDKLGRLTQLTATGFQPRMETFAYDRLGNLVSGPNTDIEYAYDGVDRDRLSAAGPRGTSMEPIAYDGAGNVVGYTPVGKAYVAITYDGASRVSSMASAAGARADFIYGPGGVLFRETTQSDAGRTEIRHYGPRIERRTVGSETRIELNVPGALGTIVSLRRKGAGSNDYSVVTDIESVYPHGDGQANRFFTNGNAATTQNVDYAAYGRTIGNSGDAASLAYTDDLWNGGDNYDTFGVSILGARVYDPTLGRFLQRDPIRITSSATGSNPYGFSAGDPVNLSDPSGLSPFPLGWIFQGLAGAGLAGGGAGQGVGDIVVANLILQGVRTLSDIAGYGRNEIDFERQVFDNAAGRTTISWYHDGMEVSWREMQRLPHSLTVIDTEISYGESTVDQWSVRQLTDGSTLERHSHTLLPTDPSERDWALKLFDMSHGIAVTGGNPMATGGQLFSPSPGSGGPNVRGRTGPIVLGDAALSSVRGMGPTRRFGSYSAFRRALGSAGFGRQWHHIVEQTKLNERNFGALAIHSTDNVLSIETGVHRQISAFYSSNMAPGVTWRRWLSTQSFETQRAFGLQTMRRYGAIP
jgi:RHS repeat-associated protein